MPKAPQTDPVSVSHNIAALSRDPFRQLLSELIDAKPDPEAVREFANKHPDRWAQAIAIFGKLSGYSERLKLENENNYLIRIQNMSDMELQAELEKLYKKLPVPLTQIPPG